MIVDGYNAPPPARALAVGLPASVNASFPSPVQLAFDRSVRGVSKASRMREGLTFQRG